MLKFICYYPVESAYGIPSVTLCRRPCTATIQMAGIGVKIVKPGGEKMDDFEEKVSQVGVHEPLELQIVVCVWYWRDLVVCFN